MRRPPGPALAVLAAVALFAPACGDRVEGDPGYEAVWMTSASALEIPRPDVVARAGMQALLQPLLYLPVGEVFPEAWACVAGSPCRLVVKEPVLIHEGTPVSAEALLAGLARQIDARSGAGGRILQAGVVTDDDGNDAIELVLDATATAMLPLLVVSRYDGERWAGTGPYRLAASSADEIRLEAVDPDRRPARLRIRRVDDDRRLLAEFLAGRVDFTFMPGHHLRLLEAAGIIGDQVELTNNEFVLLVNRQHPALAPLAVRRCLLAELGPALAAGKERARLAAPRLRPGPVTPDPGCEAILAHHLPETLSVEMFHDVDELILAHEVVIAALSRLGAKVEVRWISLSDLAEPIAGHFRVGGWSVNHPAWPAGWLSTGGSLNSGGHADLELDRLMATGAGPEALGARLADDPAFVPLGALPLHCVTSRRFAFDAERHPEDPQRWAQRGITLRVD